MIKLRTKLILCGIMSVLTLGCLGVISEKVHAADELQTGKVVLMLSPTNQQLGELKPGDKYEGKFDVINDGTDPFNYEIYTAPYQVLDDDYSPSFSTENNYTMITKWVTFDKTSDRINPGDKHTITFKVNVPENAPAGGQYASIMVETHDSPSEGMIQASSRVGMIVYSHVAGETNRCAKITNPTLSGFLINPPITGTSVIENCGNIDQEAQYILRVFPLFSNEEIYTNEDNPEKRTILPETKRFNSISWENSPRFGIFRAEQTVKIGEEENTIGKLIVICPIWLIVLILLFIGAVIFWLVARNRERKDAAAARSAAKGPEEE